MKAPVKVPEPQVPALQVDPASVQLLEQFNRAIADLTGGTGGISEKGQTAFERLDG